MEFDTLSLLRLNSTVAALLVSAGIYLQCIKIFRTRSATDLSPALVCIILYFEVSWMVYGIAIREWPMIAMTVTTLPADIGIAVGYWLYGRKAEETAKKPRMKK